MEIQLIAAFCVYFAILLFIGFISHNRSKTETDFVLGDRSVNYWVTALSAHASDMSAWLFMSFPAVVFMGGVGKIWIGIGLVFGMFVNWQFVARRLRKFTEENDSYTLSTFFEKRFEDSSGLLRTLTAIMTIVFMACYLSAELIAMGFLFESLFSINYYIGIVLATAVVIAYTLFGGFVTIAWVDFFQGMFLLGVIIVVPFFAISAMGGVQPIIETASREGIPLTVFSGEGITAFLAAMSLTFGWGLGYPGQPHIITKFMGVRDPDELYKSKYIGMTWQVLALTASACIGLIGIGFFQEGLGNSELVFVDMVKVLFHPFVTGIMLCALIAANISTMDSQILVCASVVTEDIYKLWGGKKGSLLKVSRWSVIAISLASLLIASSQNRSVVEAVLFAWSGLGCTFGPLVIMSLYLKKINRYGAFAGILVGGIIPFVWPYVSHYFASFPIPSLVPGFSLGCLMIYVVSLMFSGKPKG